MLVCRVIGLLMSSRSKQKGTAFETFIVEYFRGRGFDVERYTLHGKNDVGDVKIFGVPVTLELKNCVKLELGKWMRELEVEKVNGGNSLGAVVFKRKGCGKPEDQYVLLDVKDFVGMLEALFPEAVDGKASS